MLPTGGSWGEVIEIPGWTRRIITTSGALRSGLARGSLVTNYPVARPEGNSAASSWRDRFQTSHPDCGITCDSPQKTSRLRRYADSSRPL